MSKHQTVMSAAERLAKACEPLFDYVGECNRLARRGSPRAPQQVREQVIAIVQHIARDNASDYEIAELLAKPELTDDGVVRGEAMMVMLCFADHTLTNKDMGWKPLTGEFGIRNPDRRFVESYESAIGSSDPKRAPVLAVYYLCAGLGYGGSRTYDLAWMRDATAALGQALGPKFFGGGMVDHLVWDQPYKQTYLGDHRTRASGRVALILAAFAGSLLLLIGFSVAAYASAEGRIRASLDEINRSTGAPAPGEMASN
ncbi:MAG: hypothetical protein ACTS3F_05240 [Phycisphaerales bacterium]